MIKSIEPLFIPLNLYRSLRKLRHLEKEISHAGQNLFQIPFLFEGYGIFSSIRPKQVISEIKELYEIVERLNARYICEIGTFRGGTFYLWCKAATEDATLISIDLPSKSWDGEFSYARRSFYQEFSKSPEQKLHFLAADSHRKSTQEMLSDLLKSKQLDFLFIDGDHSYEGAKADFDLYKPFVRPGGIVVFHDILPRAEFPNIEVYRLWDELKTQYPYQEIIAQEGEFSNFIGIGVIWINDAEGADTYNE